MDKESFEVVKYINKLEDIVGTVDATGVTDFVSTGYKKGYLQDVVVQIGKAKFRTCSEFLEIQEEKISGYGRIYLESFIKAKLVARGFGVDYILNHRGLVGAVIEECWAEFREET